MSFKKLIPKKKSGNNSAHGNGKINKTENSGREIARARAIDHELAKIVKRAPALLAELITNKDRGENINVIRNAKRASNKVWDHTAKEWIEYPDHKTRLAAATLQLAYDEGTPVQRQVILTHKFDSADMTIARIKASPELLAAVKTIQGSGLEIEADGEVIDVETEFQEKGSENGVDTPE